MAETRESLVLDMVLDPICPWSFVGFRAMDWVEMALSFSYKLSIGYRPFRLDPLTPAEGRDRKAYLKAKRADQMTTEAEAEALSSAMADVGLSFDPMAPSLIMDTTDAHRLMRWAQMEGRGKEAVEGLFQAYWLHTEDLSQHAVLCEIASRIGLDADEIGDRLKTAEDLSDIRQEAEEYRASGIDSVPTFIVNESAGFSGALPKADLLATIKTLVAETQE